MIIGLDVHGVITSAPETFRRFCIWAREKVGAKVYIISGPPKHEVVEEITRLGFIEGVHYDKVFSVVDYLRATCVDMWQDKKGTWWAEDDNWWSSKAIICKTEGVDIHIDDSLNYGDYFNYIDARFVHWQRKG